MKIAQGRPQHNISSKDDTSVVVELLDTCLPMKNGPRGEMGIFSRLGQLVRCEEVGGGDYGDARLHGPSPIGLNELKTALESNFSFFITRQPAANAGGGGGAPIPVPVNLTPGQLNNLMSLGEWPHYAVPEIVGATEWLTVRPDGTLVTEPGYDPATRVYVRMDEKTVAGARAVEENPTPDHVERAKHWLLNELLVDFEWETSADRANAVAVILTGAMRYSYKGIVPLILLDATMAMSGKGTLAQVMAKMCGLDEPDVRAFPKEDDELAKSIVSTLRSSSKPFINWDNVERTVEGEALATLLTGEIYTQRLLRTNEDFVGNNDRIWCVTGNNIRLGKDIRRRSVRVRQAPTHDPREGKRVFRHADLFGWMEKNKSALVWAVGTLVRAWASAGRPEFSDHVLTEKMGSFKPWVRTVGGVLETVGIDDFLGNVSSLQYDDDATEELADMVEALEKLFRASRFTPAEAAQKFNNADTETQDALPAFLRGRTQFVNVTPRQMKSYLDSNRGRMCGIGEKRIEEAGMSGRSTAYSIVGGLTLAKDVTQSNGVSGLVGYSL